MPPDVRVPADFGLQGEIRVHGNGEARPAQSEASVRSHGRSAHLHRPAPSSPSSSSVAARLANRPVRHAQTHQIGESPAAQSAHQPTPIVAKLPAHSSFHQRSNSMRRPGSIPPRPIGLRRIDGHEALNEDDSRVKRGGVFRVVPRSRRRFQTSVRASRRPIAGRPPPRTRTAAPAQTPPPAPPARAASAGPASPACGRGDAERRAAGALGPSSLDAAAARADRHRLVATHSAAGRAIHHRLIATAQRRRP